MKDIMLLGYLTPKEHLSERIIYQGGVSFTLMAMTHGYGQGYVLVTENEEEK